MEDGRKHANEFDALLREVVALRARVAELQRAAARHEDTDGISLAEREELLREAERVAHLGTWTWDLGSGRVTWSDELFRILGLEPGCVEPSVEAFFERVHPEDRERFRSGFERALGGQPQEGHIDGRLQRPDGELRHFRMNGFEVHSPDGHHELRGTLLDVTDQVRMREELAHTQKMEAVGRLAGGIAHDFNNLLMVVMANLELMQERFGDAPEIEGSFRALTSAANLTQRLLAFGRKAQLSLKLTSPNELVRSTMELMRRLVGDEVTLELELTPDAPRVHLDRLGIERALVNLVVNARDVMPQGGRVSIRTAVRGEGARRQVEISVADRGPGVSEADRPHIFEPFYTTRARVGGTGMGLATVLGTAEQHGGTVRIEGREGGGSIFTIVLPAAEESATSSPSTPAQSAPVPRGRRLEILVIDDEPHVTALVRRMLESRGHHVLVATEPDDAMALWEAHGKAIDLVISDVAMAKMPGPQLVTRMAERGLPLRALFMTGYSEQAIRSTLQHPVIAKPFTADRLLHAIDEALVQSQEADVALPQGLATSSRE